MSKFENSYRMSRTESKQAELNLVIISVIVMVMAIARGGF